MKVTTQLAVGVLLAFSLICSNSKEFESKGPIKRSTEHRVVFIPVGINLGASCEDGDCGFLMGPEVSVYLWRRFIL